MLVNLHVKNLALIEEENIDFDEGLNILSGETGAGKSIILGSINAALGSKTSPDFIRSGCEYGLSEITFAIPEDKIERIKELGVISCDDGELVISRKIMANRSQIKVNGQSFTSAQTRVLAHELIDIHGQHDNQLLMDESNHLSVIDAYDNSIIPLLDSYKDCYKEYAICRKAYESLSGDDESRIKEMAFLQYEINELESAALKPGEDEQIEADYRRMSNFQKIAGNLSEVSMLLSEGDNNLSDMAGAALKNMIAASEYDESLKNDCDILADIENLISDVAHNLSSYMDDFTFDQSEINTLEEILDMINELPKYGNDIEEIDMLARDVANIYAKELEKHKNPRGGMFQAGLYPVSANVPLGEQTGATPDGRLANTPIADGVGPRQGADTKGPTAAANSVAKLEHGRASNGTLYNQKFHPSALSGNAGLQNFASYIRAFFDQKGMHMQFNVVSKETLLDAQKHPENYKSLVVRVAGYSALFTSLSKALQDDIISRTEQAFNA